MPQIFHPSMNTISRVSIFGFLFLVASAIGVAAFFVRSPYATEAGVIRKQPIPFSHQHHVGEAGIDCRYCHQTVETQASAGMPTTELCLGCHSHLWSDSEMLAPLFESRQTGQPVHWTRVHDLADFAYFHHGIHVQKGVACKTCHGPVDRMPLMWRSESLLMEWCLECHRQPQTSVGSPDLVFEFDERSGPSEATGDDGALADHVRRLTNCSVCHR